MTYDPDMVLIDKQELFDLKSILFIMMEEKIGYMDANKLGDPYDTATVRMAQKALGDDFDIWNLEKLDER